jgi:hypothetical protein
MEFIEEKLESDAGEVLVAFWGGKESVLEDVEDERRIGGGFGESDEMDDGFERGGTRAWMKRSSWSVRRRATPRTWPIIWRRLLRRWVWRRR